MNSAGPACCSRTMRPDRPWQLAAVCPPSQSVLLERTFQAPIALVFRHWITPAALVRWWSPCPVDPVGFAVNARAGGNYRLGIRTHDGARHWLRGIYREVIAPRRLVFTWGWEDAGNSTPASLVSVTFEALGESTRIRLRHSGFATAATHAAHAAGWEECFERLQALLASADSNLDEVLSC